MTIEIITGDLRKVASFQEGTFQHFDELSKDQAQQQSLRDRTFYVADFPIYTTQRGKPILALARHTREHPNNLAVRHLFDVESCSYEQLMQKGDLSLDPDEAIAAINEADTLAVEMSALHLGRGNKKMYQSLSIRTEDGYVRTSKNEYQAPNEAERELTKRAGHTGDFLNVLRENYGIRETRIFVFNPEYVAREVGNRFIGRAAWRDYFDRNANSILVVRNVGGQSSLRGMKCQTLSKTHC